jgi:hypothetical protein
MRIAVLRMEPWRSSYPHVPYNLGQNGVPDQAPLGTQLCSKEWSVII